MRIYEIAEKVDLTSNQVIERAKKMFPDIKESANASISDDDAEKLINEILNGPRKKWAGRVYDPKTGGYKFPRNIRR